MCGKSKGLRKKERKKHTYESNQKVSKKIILAYCIPQFAVGLFTAMISNYLLYFYQPSKESGIPTLITQGVVVLGILTFIGFVKAVGHIIDAVTDPLVANLSDKSRNKKGRRIPFMKYAAIPFGLSALLIFCAPQNTPGLVNNIWWRCSSGHISCFIRFI